VVHILALIVWTTHKNLGDFSPFVAHFCLRIHENALFLLCPRSLFDGGIQLIEISLTALFSNSSVEIIGNKAPILATVLLDQLYDFLVLLFCPWTFHEFWVEHLLPSVETLHVGSIGESFSNFLPRASIEFFNSLSQDFIFLFCPATLFGSSHRASATFCSIVTSLCW